ncbi:GTP cyclohydrolase II [Marinobacter qingdaonensis]|uniref:GTP cyclohydrolase-2 n=1 Tax=Marinobacter qingdaonensis TaxID=3108486 RepID=A0ABU5NV26_9GAMM|nr:GTP cyclohydrolase II [Marinobacter sp. ASW11-75]MEA1079634.1 GTP cyclohydrolase II [Marinobacter sp. ASW11-75]
MAVRYIQTCRLPTPFGVFDMHGFEEPDTGKEHVALTLGELDSSEPMLARTHSECLTGDALYSMRCDCGYQLEEALRSIAREGRGILLYLRQEGRGIGLLNKIRAYHLQDQGADTVEANEQLGFAADLRDYSMCKDMLEHLGIKSLRLMTNNPRKVKALSSYGIDITERVPLHVGRNPHNEQYLATKQSKLGHWLETHQDDEPDV